MKPAYEKFQKVKVKKDWRTNASLLNSKKLTVKKLTIDAIETRDDGSFFYRGFTPETEYSSRRFYFNKNEIV